MTPAGPPGPLADSEVRDAVQAALAAEHAAIWAYGLASAYLPDSENGAVATASTAHRTRRDATVQMLLATGVAPAVAAPSYRTPGPVVDGPSAAALLVTAEDDVAAGWRAACERTQPGEGAPVRMLGIDGVVSAGASVARWRQIAGTTPAVVPFPGA